jgi:hypothetical protein
MASADQYAREADRKRIVGTQNSNTGTKRTVGKRLTPIQDLYEGTPIWKRTDPITQAAISAWDAGEITPTNVGKWGGIFDATIGANNAAYEAKKNNAPPASGGGGTDNKALMAALTQYAKSLRDGTEDDGMMYANNMTDINNLYGGLADSATARAAAQEKMISDFYGGAQANANQSNQDILSRIAGLYDQSAGEVGRQTSEGQATIDQTTQRALEALGAQSNPYAGLQMADIGAVTDPMAAYSQAVGAPQGGIDALQQMLQSQNAATRGGFGNLAQLLGASQQAAQQSRIGDVNVARAGAQQDLGTTSRGVLAQLMRQRNADEIAQRQSFDQQNFGMGQNALQARLSGSNSLADFLNSLGANQLSQTFGQRDAAQAAQLAGQKRQQSLQDDLMTQLLGLAGKGIDVSQIMALLGGQ